MNTSILISIIVGFVSGAVITFIFRAIKQVVASQLPPLPTIPMWTETTTYLYRCPFCEVEHEGEHFCPGDIRGSEGEE